MFTRSTHGVHRISRRAVTALALAAATALTGSQAAFAAGGHDDHGGGGGPLAADADRCDLGFNTKGYNDSIKAGKQHDLSPTWSDTFLQKEPEYHRLSWTDKLAYSSVRYATKNAYDGMVATGHDNHPLTDPWEGMTDPVECDALKGQLREVLEAVRKYPTLGDAQRAGYGLRTPYFAGSGTHVVLKGVDDDPDYEADPAVPPSLLYDGMGRNASVVGAMFGYETTREMDTDIFAGDNGSWHQHRGLCYSNSPVLGMMWPNATRFVIGSEATSPEACKRRGGYKDDSSALYMSHVWVVPGCENPYGVFAHDNPRLTKVLNVRSGRAGTRGCGSGKAVTDPLAMETDELNVPGKHTQYRSSQYSWSEGGQAVATGPVAVKVADHPGENHAGGELHFTGTLATEAGFTGPAGNWPVSISRKDGVIRGSVTTPAGTVATFTSGTATNTDAGVELVASATTPTGAAVELRLAFADRGLREWFSKSQGESLEIHHPAHGHDHAGGPVTFAFATHPGENHVGEEHLFGTATTKDAFEGDAGAWIVSFTKNTVTKQVNGYLKNPADSKRFNFSVTAHHDAEECAGGVHLEATGSEQATPGDPQNPELVICDPAVTAFFANHDHGQTPPPTTPGTPSPTTPTTPVPTTPGDGHEHEH